MRTNDEGEARPATFTQRKRRDQLVDCAIDALAELGFQGTSVAEVARRAGVSRGVVTYHFAAKDDLMFAAVAEIFDSIKEFLENRLRGTSPERFVADYINAWVAYYRTRTRYVLAIREIWATSATTADTSTSDPRRSPANWAWSSRCSSTDRPTTTSGSSTPA